jgi:hypothetical protein
MTLSCITPPYSWVTWSLNLSISLLIILVGFVGCTDFDSKTRKPVYVGPSVDYKGKFRKGYVRMPVSTKKNAVKKQNSSRYYYQTRGKQRRKSKK